MSFFFQVPNAAADPILGLTTAFNNCTSPDKVNLGVGAYRDGEGKPVIFKAVRDAEQQYCDAIQSGRINKEYLPSGGNVTFTEQAKEMVCGDKKGDFASVQALGGTGALKIGMEYAKMSVNGFDSSYPRSPLHFDTRSMMVLVTKPTWPNHHNIAADCGLTVTEYSYFSPATLGVDEQVMEEDLMSKVKRNDIVLLHAVGHNPTGADISIESMKRVFKIIVDRGAICFLDLAYHGFVSGCLSQDLINVQCAIDEFPDMPLMIAQSFSKNMGMYGERLGALHVRTKDTAASLSQLNLIIRRVYSNPPRHPSDVASIVLTDHMDSWKEELKEVANRIDAMRLQLKTNLTSMCPKTNWDHITKQRGMFAYTGLSLDEVTTLREEHYIFMANSGRISVSGLNDGNLKRVAEAIATVRCNSQAKL
eukprot:GHVH01001457.1.p1 GENE.GHVH01001457.1~~GHVH01001457.1.p1  ORF type:complete len:420 (+),score=62.84 GHVH01001457.1:41-1300(+)